MAKFRNIPPEHLALLDLRVKRPLELEWLGSEPKLAGGRRADARIRLTHRGESKTFIVEYKKLWTGAALQSAIQQVREYAELSPGDLPLVVVPYLSEEHLETLLAARVSGLDLLGNGVIDADKWLLVFSGKPNKFKNTQAVKSPYQGKSALVARTLLSCPVLPNAEALRAEVEQRGGKVSQPVVSRALKAFRDDLVVGIQAGQGIVLLQPEKLLDRLTQQWKLQVERWKASGQTVLWSGQVAGSPEEFLPKIFANAHENAQPAVLTGLKSSVQLTHLTSESTQYLYSERVGSLLRGLNAKETRRFTNFEVWLPPDQAVFFDPVVTDDGWRWGSVLQTYLELVTGDVRLQQSAEELRDALLNVAEEKKNSLLSKCGAT